MIMRLALAIFLVSGSPVFAQDVVVRAGEHGEFTRVFLSGVATDEWNLSRSESGYSLLLPAGTLVNTERLFDRIDRSRIGDVNFEANSLLFQLNCLCGVETFVIAGQGLVMDFSESTKTESVTPDLGGAFDTSSGTRILADLDWKRHRAPWRTTASVLLPEASPLPETRGLEKIRSRLISEIATAATDGLLSHSVIGRAPGSKFDENVGVQVTLDSSAMKHLDSEIITQPDKLACSGSDIYAVSGWGDPETFNRAISESRRQLIDEAGAVDDAWLRSLFYAHIYSGFGLEARALLLSFPEALDDADILLAIAELIEPEDGSGPSQYETLDWDRYSCSQGLQMWRILAQLSIEEPQKNASLAEFSSLPAHLRWQIGPRLIETFLAAGDQGSAQLVRAAIDRLTDVSDDELLGAYALMQESSGNERRAEEIYRGIVHGGDDRAVVAAPKYVEMVAARGGEVSDYTTGLIEAVSFEHQGTEKGQVLDATVAKSFLLGGDLISALEHLRSSDVSPSDLAEIDEIMLEVLIVSESPTVGIAAYLQDPSYFLTRTGSRELRIEMRRILDTAGFRTQAQKFGGIGAPLEPDTELDSLPIPSDLAEGRRGGRPIIDGNLVERGQTVLYQSEEARDEISSLLAEIK